MKNQTKIADDLKPRGIRSTIKGNYGFNDTFNHIFKQFKKYK